MRTAKRIKSLPQYLFAELDLKKAEARARGVDVIDFGVGDPDLPTADHIVEAAAKAVSDPATHRYPSYFGMDEFRNAIASYYKRRFDVELDPNTQVLPLIGSKEGIAHLALAFVDPDDVVLVPDPGYPVYEVSTLLAGGRPVPVVLSPEDGYMPALDEVSPDQAMSAKMIWLNYPNNPTAATCEPDLFEKAIDFCQNFDLLLAHDAAYVEITYDGYRAPSLMQARGGPEVGIEFGSLSKMFNMTGWRVGWAVGAPTAIEALGRVKTNLDSGVFNAIQIAATTALEGPADPVKEVVEVYRRRRDLLVDGLTGAGLSLKRPKGSIYLWVKTPGEQTSLQFSEFLLEKAGVVVAPGSGYGRAGEGYVRFSLTIDDSRLLEGVDRIVRALAQL
ncbi:MAG: LL-diaminopimelate aminotransferase [Actinomycetota bacterium]